MASHRFRLLGTPQNTDRFLVTGDEAFHLVKVLRLPPGAAVEVFDGAGRVGRGRLALGANERQAVVELEQPATLEAPPARRHRLAIGALKPASVDDLLPGLTELGIDEVHIFGQPGSARDRLSPKAEERWQRITVAAAKQCKRAYLPSVHLHADLASMVARLPAGRSGWVLSPEASRSALAALVPANPLAWDLAQSRNGPDACTAVVGGEKGLSAAEEERLREAGFTPIRLGAHILRATTAALAIASLLALSRDDAAK